MEDHVEDETEAVVPETERLPVEEWATKKGLYPQMIVPVRTGIADANPVPGGVGLFLDMSREGNFGPRTNASFWKFAAAKAHNKWPIGLTVTEDEFDKAIVAATDGITLR